MKKAINAWSVDPKSGFEEMFAQLKEAGFDGVELNVDGPNGSPHSLSIDTADEQLAEIKALSDKYSLPVVSISTSQWAGGENMGTGDAEKIAFGKRLIEQQLKCAGALGAKGILVVPGGICERVSIARAYENSLKNLTSWFPIINEYKLFVGVENVWNTFFLSPFDMREFVDKCGSPYIGAYYDVGNVVAFTWTEYWIEILAHRIGLIHIKDFARKGMVNCGGTFCDLGTGSIVWERVIPALRNAGFDGYLTAEVGKSGKYSAYPEFYRATAETIDKFIQI